MQIIYVSYQFLLINPKLFNESLEHLQELGVEVSPDNTLEENTKLIVVNLDVLALSPTRDGLPIGWNDVGLERID